MSGSDPAEQALGDLTLGERFVPGASQEPRHGAEHDGDLVEDC